MSETAHIIVQHAPVSFAALLQERIPNVSTRGSSVGEGGLTVRAAVGKYAAMKGGYLPMLATNRIDLVDY